MEYNAKIELGNLTMVKEYLRELLIDNFAGININEDFVCKIPNFSEVRIIIK